MCKNKYNPTAEMDFKERRGSYNYKIIHKYICDAGCAWDLEKELHAKYKEFQYFPIDSFQGYTECFTTDLPIEEIKEYLKNI